MVFNYNKMLPKSIMIGKTAVVIDVFRATSVITTALAYGVREIIPSLTIEEALKEFTRKGEHHCILGGEQKMQKIDGFHFGNSPQSYIKNVKDKIIILTTTNGTQAINLCRQANKIYIASFLNAKHVTELLQQNNEEIVILCAGSKGSFALEDALCAGKLLYHLSKTSNIDLDDFAWSLKNMYETNKNNLWNFIANASAFSALLNSGFGKDLEFCLQEDIYPIVPQYKNGKIN